MNSLDTDEADEAPQPQAVSPHQGNHDTDDIEMKHVKPKDLHYLKFPAVPEDAGAFRQFRNSVVLMLSAYDRSAAASAHSWVMRGMNARSEADVTELQQSSGNYPRLDRIIASALTRPEHLKSHFGLKFQGFLEDSEALVMPLRGRVLLNMVCPEFDTDATYGAVVSELELFSLPPPELSMQALKAWRDKVRYILGQLLQAQRPPERLMSKWLFERLKRVPQLRRHTDRRQREPSNVNSTGYGRS